MITGSFLKFGPCSVAFVEDIFNKILDAIFEMISAVYGNIRSVLLEIYRERRKKLDFSLFKIRITDAIAIS